MFLAHNLLLELNPTSNTYNYIIMFSKTSFVALFLALAALASVCVASGDAFEQRSLRHASSLVEESSEDADFEEDEFDESEEEDFDDLEFDSEDELELEFEDQAFDAEFDMELDSLDDEEDYEDELEDGERRRLRAFSKGSRRSGTLIAKIRKYPGSYAPTPRGRVIVRFQKKNVGLIFSYNVRKLPKNCKNCGVHIHVGKTCKTDAKVGGHYWREEVYPDPWVPEFGATYNSNAYGRARGYFSVTNGYGYGDNKDHAIVFHAQDGSRIG